MEASGDRGRQIALRVRHFPVGPVAHPCRVLQQPVQSLDRPWVADHGAQFLFLFADPQGLQLELSAGEGQVGLQIHLLILDTLEFSSGV